MKTNNVLKVLAAALAGGVMAGSASAVPILINPDYGTVIIPANETEEYNAFVAAIANYNSAHDPDLPAAGDIDTTPQLIGGGTSTGFGHVNMPDPTPISITIDFGIERETYAGLTWDGPNGGTLVYYVGNETGPVTFYSPFFPAPRQNNPDNTQQYGLSHYMFTGPITTPDGGLTVGLLGMAVAAIGMVAWKIR